MPRQLRPGEALIIGSATPIFRGDGATGPRVVSARFGDAAAQAIRHAARARGMTLAAYVNRVVASAAAIDKLPDPAVARANVAAWLGVAADATDEQIVSALQAMLAAVAGESADDSAPSTPDAATAESADPQPMRLARSLVDPRALSPAQQKQWLAGRAQLRAARGAVLTSNKKVKR